MKRVRIFAVLVCGMFVFSSMASADLVGYFKFDEFDRTVFEDDSGQGMTGFLGMPYSDPEVIQGPSGNADDFAVSFDGEGGLIVDDSAAEVLNILEPPITLECWARSSTDPGGHIGLISYGIPGGRAGGGGYKLGISDGNILFTLFAVVDVWTEVPFPFDGEWHHVAGVYNWDEGGVIIYVDGVEEQFLPGDWGFTEPGAKELDIGTQYTAIGRFIGDIDRVRISTAALGPDELDTDPASMKPVQDHTAAFFGFDEGEMPFTSEGAEPPLETISLPQWVIENPPAESTGAPAVVDDSPSGEAGDTSLEFSGTQIAVVDDSNGVLNFSDGDWTLEAWAKTDFNTDVIRMVMFYYGHPGHGYSFSINLETETLQVTTLGIADMPSDSAYVIPDYEWHHLAVVHKAGDSITYFIDGQEIESNSYTNLTIPADPGMTKLYIGAEPDMGLPYTGLLDRIRISNSALTPDQMDTDAAPAAVSGWMLR